MSLFSAADVTDSPKTKAEAIPFIVDRSSYFIVTLTHENPLNIFTFRYTGLEESTMLKDEFPRIY